MYIYVLVYQMNTIIFYFILLLYIYDIAYCDDIVTLGKFQFLSLIIFIII